MTGAFVQLAVMSLPLGVGDVGMVGEQPFRLGLVDFTCPPFFPYGEVRRSGEVVSGLAYLSTFTDLP